MGTFGLSEENQGIDICSEKVFAACCGVNLADPNRGDGGREVGATGARGRYSRGAGQVREGREAGTVGARGRYGMGAG